jgi:hypothetical protein
MRLVDLFRLGWPRDIVYSFFDHSCLCVAFQLLYDLKGVSTVKGGCKLIRLVVLLLRLGWTQDIVYCRTVRVMGNGVNVERRGFSMRL